VTTGADSRESATSATSATSAGQAALPFDLPLLVRAMRGEDEVDLVPIGAVEPGVGPATLGRGEPREESFRLIGAGRLFAATARWHRRRGPPECWDVELDVTPTSTGAPALEAGLVVAVRLRATEDPHWLIPGLFYGENRPAASRAEYPRYGAPLLGDPWTAPAWGFRVDRAASPVVFARDADRGIALATTEVGPMGLNGLGFGAIDATGDGGPPGTVVPELRLAYPYREEPVAYDGSADPRPPDRPTHRWSSGETVTLRFRVYPTAAAAYAWAPVLEAVHQGLAAASPLHPWLHAEGAARLAAEGLLRWHVRMPGATIAEAIAFERPGDGRGPASRDREAMHVAWLSGTTPAAALLRHGQRAGDAAAKSAGAAVLDNIAAHLAPCGTFWGQWTPELGWTKGWTPGEDRLHARTIGEAALFMARAAALVEDQAAAARWRDAATSNVEFVVARQRADGAIPAAWHACSGEATSWDGCAGLAWVPPLLQGATLLDRTDLVEPARRAGRYYSRFVDDELLFGAPEDVDLGPTSEDGYVAVMAYVALAEASAPGSERDRWVALARKAAAWMLSFRCAWNVAFDPATTLGRLDYRTRGMDQASPANQHLHTYGLIALDATARLGALTGEPLLLERAREHFAAARQLIARFDGDFGARRGMVPERAYQTACFGPKGEIDPLSHAWCLGLLLWACEDAIASPHAWQDPPDAFDGGPA
jgi:hypothetical protein